MTGADRCPDCGVEWVEDGPFGDRLCGGCGTYADRGCDDGPVWTPVVTINTGGRT
jgi:hypothetical protein